MDKTVEDLKAELRGMVMSVIAVDRIVVLLEGVIEEVETRAALDYRLCRLLTHWEPGDLHQSTLMWYAWDVVHAMQEDPPDYGDIYVKAYCARKALLEWQEEELAWQSYESNVTPSGLDPKIHLN